MFGLIKRMFGSVVDKAPDTTSLQATYAQMSTERLQKINPSELTPIARAALNAELTKRNVPKQ